MFLNTWGFFTLRETMSTYSATEASYKKMLDEVIDILIDARENNGAALRSLEINTNIPSYKDLPEYKINLTLVKYK